MKVSVAVATRKSVRGFLDRPVAADTIRRVLDTAARAPSGGNLQPWHIHVVGGEALEKLKRIMRTRIVEAPQGEAAEYEIYPKELVPPYRERRFQIGEELYARLGIPREDKAGRAAQFARNFQLFGAPLALFCSVDRRMGPPQWSDLGMFLQTVMLLLREEDLDSCAQECWSIYPETVRRFLDIPAERIVFSGMAIGYEDPGAPANHILSARATLAEFAQFMGI